MHKVMIIGLFLFLGNFPSVWGQEEKKCKYTLRDDSMVVKWTAYKTPMKVGVNGSFQKIKMMGQKEGETILQIVRHSQFEIDATSTDTRDKVRDLKIVKNVFESMEDGPKIRGKVVGIKEETLEFELTMNGVTKTVPMSFNFARGTFKATGIIDILDFTMSEQLRAITKACSAKHEKKTWNDVNIEVFAKFSKKCS